MNWSPSSPAVRIAAVESVEIATSASTARVTVGRLSASRPMAETCPILTPPIRTGARTESPPMSSKVATSAIRLAAPNSIPPTCSDR